MTIIISLDIHQCSIVAYSALLRILRVTCASVVLSSKCFLSYYQFYFHSYVCFFITREWNCDVAGLKLINMRKFHSSLKEKNNETMNSDIEKGDSINFDKEKA